jgi:hypothetical protein
LLPLLEGLFIPFARTDISDSSQAAIIANCIAAAVIGSLLVFSVGLAVVFMHEEQFNSPLPWTMSSLWVDYCEVLKKVLIAACSSLDIRGSGQVYYVLLLLIVATAEFWAFMNASAMDKHWVYLINICCQVTCWLFYLIYTLQILVGKELVHYLALMAFFLPAAVASAVAIRRRVQTQLTTQAVGALREAGQVESFIRGLLRLIDSKHRLAEYATLLGILKHHSGSCSRGDCPCRSLMAVEQEEPSEQADQLSSNKGDNIVKIKAHVLELPSDSRLVTITHDFVNNVLQQSISRIGKQCRLYVLSGYIHFLLLQNKFQALYDLQQAEELTPTLYEEYMLFRLKYLSMP